jgi:hypothetical protein
LWPGGSYLFTFKVEVVDAFDSKIAARLRDPGNSLQRTQRARSAKSGAQKQKSLPMAGFFFSYSISSEYHTERIKPPKYLERIKV